MKTYTVIAPQFSRQVVAENMGEAEKIFREEYLLQRSGDVVNIVELQDNENQDDKIHS